jgi:hypothetical protein
MPIRINLLAEEQAAEQIRKRDPVKRSIWLAALLVVAMLVWSSSIQVKVMISRSSLNQKEASVASLTNEYVAVLEGQRRATETQAKLDALFQLSTNRFLNASLLNALQHCVVENVQLTRIKVDQTYDFTPEVKTKPKSGSDRPTPGKPATVTEKMRITLDAKDASQFPGDQVSKLREAILTNAYISVLMGKTNEVLLTKLSPPQGVPGEPAFVSFTLECQLPGKTR